MSDSIDSLGMIFQTTADTSASTGVLDSLSGLFTSDSGAAPTDAAATPAPTPPPDVSASPAEQAPPPAEIPTAAQTTGDTQPPAGVSEGSTPMPGSGAGSGVVNSAATWYKNLSPGAQAILASGVAGGAAGVLNSLAQKNILDEKKREIDQSREDVQRKGQISAFGESSFKPKGLIDGARGG